MYAGDQATAREYVSASVQHDRETGDTAQLFIGLRNLAECLGRLGLPGPAQETATEALDWAERSLDGHQVRDAHACLAWAAGLHGVTPPGPSSTSWSPISSSSPTTRPAATTCTPTAASGGPSGWPAPAAAGRPGSWPTTTRNCAGTTAGTTPWPAANACSGLFELEDEDDFAEAGRYLESAASRLRDAAYLPDLAETLPALAGYAAATGDPDAAHRYLTEAIAIAAPRGLVPPTAPRWPPGPACGRPGPGRRRRRAGPGHQPRTALVRTRRAARPRRPGRGRDRRPRLGGPRRCPASPAGPTRPGPRPAENRRTRSRRARHNARSSPRL